MTIEIPTEFLDVIAALVQDSDEHFTVLVNRINDILSPFQRKEDVAHRYDLAIEKAVKAIAQKMPYGLGHADYVSMEHHAPNVPWVSVELDHIHLIRLCSIFVFIDGK
ncbi:uncharacterized protein B0P05DRAFT_469850 [Gilbertella persicaria]|uniref:uncharacterized protein n=1 Tax=Gilbertella persicaria TaxID=101096 RepID=UPI00221E930D|nr:uncharacterized protein B0P05DRAFT_469850 [Gilbertella persicaria]KAI8079698.1 hypothetical protein B0P05DRAFT_469850 [Gilbertella persicaria]